MEIPPSEMWWRRNSESMTVVPNSFPNRVFWSHPMFPSQIKMKLKRFVKYLSNWVKSNKSMMMPRNLEMPNRTSLNRLGNRLISFMYRKYRLRDLLKKWKISSRVSQCHSQILDIRLKRRCSLDIKDNICFKEWRKISLHKKSVQVKTTSPWKTKLQSTKSNNKNKEK